MVKSECGTGQNCLYLYVELVTLGPIRSRRAGRLGCRCGWGECVGMGTFVGVVLLFFLFEEGDQWLPCFAEF